MLLLVYVPQERIQCRYVVVYVTCTALSHLPHHFMRYVVRWVLLLCARTQRFAAGSFTMCLKLLFQHLTGVDLEVGQYGKPLPVMFNYARQVLEAWRSQNVQPPVVPVPLRRIFMVGDNPKADIRGANSAGKPWTSVLVETGVYRGRAVGLPNDPVDPAHLVCRNVTEAVDAVIMAAHS